MTEKDHDILIEIRSDLRGHIKDLEEHREDFKKHVRDDFEVFKLANERLDKFDLLLVKGSTVVAVLFTVFIGVPKVVEFIQGIQHFLNK